MSATTASELIVAHSPSFFRAELGSGDRGLAVLQRLEESYLNKKAPEWGGVRIPG